MPDDSLTEFTLVPDGNRVVVPIRSNSPASGQRIVIEGVMSCGYNNQVYDALYACDQNGVGDTARPHALLAWQPYPPIVEEADVRTHRYVLRFPNLAAGVSPTVRVDVDRLVNEFLIPPSEVKRSLFGRFDISVTTSAVASPAPSAWPAALAAAPALALVGGVAWVIHRRMTLTVLDFDLEAQLARIHLKSDAARSTIGRRDARLVPILARLKALEMGSSKLVKQIQQVRGACKLHSRFALEKEIDTLERQARPDGAARDYELVPRQRTAAPDGVLTEDLLLTLADKRNSLASLAGLEKTEARLTARLNRVESILESTLAGLQSVKAGAVANPVSESLCRSLDAEVSALREASRPPPETILLGGINRN